jgi:hypothetical protein
MGITKSEDGMYHIRGKKFEMLCGSRAQVWHHTAYKTSGGLTRDHLIQNKSGRIVSKKKHGTAKREKRLVKAGYGTRKGKFGYVKLHSKKSRKHGGSQPSLGFGAFPSALTSNIPPADDVLGKADISNMNTLATNYSGGGAVLPAIQGSAYPEAVEAPLPNMPGAYEFTPEDRALGATSGGKRKRHSKKSRSHRRH